jgi:hypothetical protein
MKKVVIFCQAAGDIKYTLSLYEQFRDAAQIDIYLLPGHPAFRFIADSDLSANIHWIEEPPQPFSLKRIGRLWSLRKYVSKLWKQYFREYKGAEVYFFSEVIDWITLSMVARLSKRNKVVHLEHYPYAVGPALDLRLKERVYMWLFKRGTQTEFRFCRLGDSVRHRRQIELNLKHYHIQSRPAELAEGVTEKFRYPIQNADSAMLFIDSPSKDLPVSNYEEVMREFLGECLKRGMRIMVKPHPRIPLHPLYKEYRIEVIPAYVPGEFLPTSEFKWIGGIMSTLLGGIAAQRHAFSMMNCLNWKDEGARVYAENLLKHHSKGNIMLIGRLDQLSEELRTRR